MYIVLSLSHEKYRLIHLKILKRFKNENITLKHCVQQDNVAPTTQHYID